MILLKHPASAFDHTAIPDTLPVFTSLEKACISPDKVYRLHLNRKKLKTIPAEVFHFTNLVELNLANNRIEIIPGEIHHLKNLQVLNVSNNRIHTVSDSIGSLTELEILDLSRNFISRIPSTIQNLHKLQHLELWKNEIGRMPEEAGVLKNNLIYLDLRLNPLPQEQGEKLEQLLPMTEIRRTRVCACKSG